MDFFKCFIIVGILKCTVCTKVYEWTSNWGSGLSTRELAHVHDTDKTVTHFATDDGALLKSEPAVNLYDYKFTDGHFDKGILIVRPLVSDGNQVCFIARADKDWTETVDDVSRRHGMTISAPASFNMFNLTQSYPLGFDPLSVPIIQEFCSVDTSHIFYLDPVKSVKNVKKMKIHGLFGRLTVGVTENLISTVFV